MIDQPTPDPDCAHCGEAVTGAMIREWAGPAGGIARTWHGDRDACRTAALPAPAPACGEECAEGHAYAGRCTQADPLPVSTCPRTHRHGYHMWPDQPGPALCPGHPAPPVDVVAAMTGDGGDTTRTAPDNPAASNNGELRDQMCEAIIELQQANLRAGGGGLVAPGYIADAVLAVRDAELQQLRADMERYEENVIGELNETNTALARRAETAEAKLAAVRERRQGVPMRAHIALAEQAGKDQAALARVRNLADIWLREGTDTATRTAGRYVLAALDGPADTTPPAEDTCRPVQVGDDTIHVHGSRAMTEQEAGYLGEIVAAARAHLVANPPVVPDDDGTESALTRRIRARQRGAVVDVQPGCTATLRLGDTLIHCTDHRPGVHRGPVPGSDSTHAWGDYAAGATPHCPAATEVDR